MQKTLPSLITFAVDAVTPAGELLTECRAFEAVKRLVQSEIESCHGYHGMVLEQVNYHGLLAAVYMAFSGHRPLVLSPDMIWLTITQGIAQHMAIHAERLRPRFVEHEGREVLKVDINHFIKGSPENPWEEAFAGWSWKIREYIGAELHEQLVCNFSTTGAVERAASEIVLMDIFERYFHFAAGSICGIPTITLEGTVEDWWNLRERIESLAVFDLDWWLEHLRPIADEFLTAAQGEINLAHWQGICKLREAYGGDVINGWIAWLFPYLGLSARLKNPIFETGKGFQTSSAPSGLSRVPFMWTIESAGVPAREFAMEAIAGFTGVEQSRETMALRPKIGWAVREVAGIATQIDRCTREHETFPGIDVKGTPVFVEPRHEGIMHGAVPEDLGRFYHTSNGCNLFKGRFQILPFERLKAFLENDPVQRRRRWCRFCELSDGGFLIMDLRTRYIPPVSVRAEEATIEAAWKDRREAEHACIKESMDRWLKTLPQRPNPKEIEARRERLEGGSPVLLGYMQARFSKNTEHYRAHFIVACARDAITPSEPIIAESFSDFLGRALDSKGEYWWREPGFQLEYLTLDAK